MCPAPCVCSHSKVACSPKTVKLSTYSRAVSKSDRATSAPTTPSRVLISAVSTAKGEPYRAVSSSEIRPEPMQTTLSASPPASESTGLTAWVA
jgi:hypothetical protein